MGALAKALNPPSAYAVKRDHPDLWADLVDRIDGAILAGQLNELVDELDARPFDIPLGWRMELDDLIDRRREALAEEDIGSILRDRFDF